MNWNSSATENHIYFKNKLTFKNKLLEKHQLALGYICQSHTIPAGSINIIHFSVFNFPKFSFLYKINFHSGRQEHGHNSVAIS